MLAQNSDFVQMNAKLTAKDSGGAGLKDLQYQISSSSTIPADNDANWKTFTNGSAITEEKAGGTWYLYTKVTDNAGNRETSIQKSNPFIVNYSVEYDANGGTGAPNSQIKENNKALTLSTTKPTRTGYNFIGWSTNKNSSTAEYQPGATYTANASTTLYAVWQAKQVEVTFVKNTSSTDNTSVKQTFTYGITGQKFSDKGWTKTGYTLLGWNENRNAMEEQYSILSGVSDSWINDNSPEITLYAVWKDSTIPVIGSLTANTTAWTNGNVTLTGKARDLGSGLSYYQFSTNASLTSASSGWTTITNTTAEITKTYTVTANGTYYFYVKDASSNINKKSIVIKNIDKIAPTASYTVKKDSGEATITITAQDNLSGVKSIINTTTENITKINDTTYKVTTNGSYDFKIIDNANNTTNIVVNVTGILFEKPTNPDQQVPGVTFFTIYGKIDIIWLDTENKVISKPNVPELTSNGESLTPLKWDEGNNIVPTTADDSNWYDYDTNRWANAKTKNESLFVWIPRYAYRITYYESETSDKVTGYYDGYGQWSAETGEIRVAIDSGIEKVDYNGEKYIVHPAFETNLDNGGWNKDLSGIWVAKFEANGTGPNLKFTYGVSSTRSEEIGTQYTSARQATYGYAGQKGEDGNTSFMNSHMMKNSEWGAVAYLTHSKYGLNGKEISINDNSSYYTGGGTGEAYKTNTNQSTTGNVYGIYDLSGNAWERVAAFNSVDTNRYFSRYGWTTATGLTTESASTKYATKYNNTASSSSRNKIIYTVGKVGDATKEVNIGGSNNITNTTSKYNNWFSDYPDLANSVVPFFARGGSYDSGSNAGVFYSHYTYGYSSGNYDSFRAVLAR